MQDEVSEWTRETTWRQGRVLGVDAASAAGLACESDVCVLVISHDCDLAIHDLDIEPNVEVIVGRSFRRLTETCHGVSPRGSYTSR